MTKDRFTSRVAKDPACCVAAVLDFHRSATKQRALKTLFDDRRDGIILYRAADGKRRTPGGATRAAFVPSAGDIPEIVNLDLAANTGAAQRRALPVRFALGDHK